MRNRKKQRANRAKAKREARGEPTGPSVSQIIDGFIGIAIGLAFLYWFFTGMWASCARWVPF